MALTEPRSTHMETSKPRPPQASVVNESERSEGRIYHRYAEDKRERVEAGSLHVRIICCS
jgi:hypothetical protein